MKIATLSLVQFLVRLVYGVLGMLHVPLALLKDLLLLFEPSAAKLLLVLNITAVIVLLLRDPNNVLLTIVQFLVNTRLGLILLIALIPAVVVFVPVVVQ
jgi:hypothetical protein